MRKAEAIRGFGWNAFFTLINRIGLPLVNVVIATLIGPAGFGDYAALNSTYVIIELFREAGLGLTFIADKEISPERERTYNFISVANGFVFAAILFAGRHWVADVFNQPDLALALAVLSFAMVVASVGTIPALKLARAARFRDIGLIDTIINFVSIFVAVIAYKLGAGFMSLVYQMVGRSILFCILYNVVSPAAWGKASLTQAKEIMSTAIANMSTNLAYTIYTMGDYVLVRTVLGPAANGIYTFAFNIANKPVEIVTGPLRQTMLVALSRDQDDPERLNRNFGRAFGAAILLSAPAYLLILFNSHALIKIFPGSGFDGAVPYLQILCAYLFMRSIATIAAAALVSSGRERWTLYGWIPAYIVAIGYLWAHWPLVPAGFTSALDPSATPPAATLEGLKTVVIGLSLGAITCYVVYIIVAFRLAKPPPDVRERIVKFIVISLATGVAIVGTSFLPIHEYSRLGVAVLAAFVVQGALVSKELLGSYRSAFSMRGLKRVVGEL